jgi:hypothetical protein
MLNGPEEFSGPFFNIADERLRVSEPQRLGFAVLPRTHNYDAEPQGTACRSRRTFSVNRALTGSNVYARLGAAVMPMVELVEIDLAA